MSRSSSGDAPTTVPTHGASTRQHRHAHTRRGAGHHRRSQRQRPLRRSADPRHRSRHRSRGMVRRRHRSGSATARRIRCADRSWWTAQRSSPPWRKHVPQRRLVSIAMVGIDLRDGTLLWTTTIGQCGHPVHQPRRTLHRGACSPGHRLSHRRSGRHQCARGPPAAASSGPRRIPSTTLINTVAGWPWGTVMPLIDEGAADGSTPAAWSR